MLPYEAKLEMYSQTFKIMKGITNIRCQYAFMCICLQAPSKMVPTVPKAKAEKKKKRMKERTYATQPTCMTASHGT